MKALMEVAILPIKANQAMHSHHLAWETQVFILDMQAHHKKFEPDTDKYMKI
jgi:hypothetical protein